MLSPASASSPWLHDVRKSWLSVKGTEIHGTKIVAVKIYNLFSSSKQNTNIPLYLYGKILKKLFTVKKKNPLLFYLNKNLINYFTKLLDEKSNVINYLITLVVNLYIKFWREFNLASNLNRRVCQNISSKFCTIFFFWENPIR